MEAGPTRNEGSGHWCKSKIGKYCLFEADWERIRATGPYVRCTDRFNLCVLSKHGEAFIWLAICCYNAFDIRLPRRKCAIDEIHYWLQPSLWEEAIAKSLPRRPTANCCFKRGASCHPCSRYLKTKTKRARSRATWLWSKTVFPSLQVSTTQPARGYAPRRGSAGKSGLSFDKNGRMTFLDSFDR